LSEAGWDFSSLPLLPAIRAHPRRTAS
jgi:hypothetical protein